LFLGDVRINWSFVVECVQWRPWAMATLRI